MQMEEEKPFREEVPRVSSLTRSHWSSWYVALVPEAPENNSKNYEPRNKGHHGSIYKGIRKRFGRRKYDDGIYELSVKKRGSRERIVVYIGAAHRDGPGSLSKRIMEYCKHGSHKAELFNRAMRLGYTLSVRVQNIRGRKKHVYECENRYLAKYDYAWNERNNGHIRGNVPPP